VAVIAIASGPWFGIVRHPQWDRLTLVPFHGSEDKPRDIAVNLLMFVPFGWSFAKSRGGRMTTLQAIGAGALVSIAVEIPQLFYRLRDPSATDVVMAMIGTAVGSLASQAFHGRYAGGTARGRETGDGGRQE
jgi:glycopeptide antibiotics resistance protein